MTLEEAIRLIQVHERARQGRLRAKFMREIRQQEEREKKASLRGGPTLDPEVAAVRIQKVGTRVVNVVDHDCTVSIGFDVQLYSRDLFLRESRGVHGSF